MILDSAYEDPKFIKFYETKFNLTSDSISPFRHEDDLKNTTLSGRKNNLMIKLSSKRKKGKPHYLLPT